MDNLVLWSVASALCRGLDRAVLEDVRAEPPHRTRWRFVREDRGRSLLVSLEPSDPWTGWSAERRRAPAGAPDRFLRELRRRLVGRVVTAVDKPGADRSIVLRFGEGAVVLELATHGANLVLLDRDDRVVAAARAPRSARDRLRAGVAYVPSPVPPHLLDPFGADPEEIGSRVDDAVASGDPPFEGLRRRLFGVGTPGARRIAEEARRTGRPIGEVCRARLDDVVEGRATPCIVASADPRGAVDDGIVPERLELWPWRRDSSDAEDSAADAEDVTVCLPDAAATAGLYHTLRDRGRWLRDRAAGLEALVRDECARLERARGMAERDLAAFSDPDRHRIDGEAVLAGLAVARRRGAAVQVPDPYDPQASWREVHGPAGASLPEIAERCFARHRRAVRGREAARERRDALGRRLAALSRLDLGADRVRSLEDVDRAEAALRSAGVAIGLAATRRAAETDRIRSRPRAEGVRLFTAPSGAGILAGKSAKENHRLTFRLAAPEDFWLHALERTGAHVVLRNAGRGAAPDPADLAFAAGIAAWFSEARSQERVDVQWTRRKYVRKARGGPPGAVILKRFQTVRVAPRCPEEPDDGPAGAPGPVSG